MSRFRARPPERKEREEKHRKVRGPRQLKSYMIRRDTSVYNPIEMEEIKAGQWVNDHCDNVILAFENQRIALTRDNLREALPGAVLYGCKEASGSLGSNVIDDGRGPVYYNMNAIGLSVDGIVRLEPLAMIWRAPYIAGQIFLMVDSGERVGSVVTGRIHVGGGNLVSGVHCGDQFANAKVFDPISVRFGQKFPCKRKNIATLEKIEHDDTTRMHEEWGNATRKDRQEFENELQDNPSDFQLESDDNEEDWSQNPLSKVYATPHDADLYGFGDDVKGPLPGPTLFDGYESKRKREKVWSLPDWFKLFPKLRSAVANLLPEERNQMWNYVRIYGALPSPLDPVWDKLEQQNPDLDSSLDRDWPFSRLFAWHHTALLSSIPTGNFTDRTQMQARKVRRKRVKKTKKTTKRRRK